MNELKVGELLFYPMHGVGLLEEKVALSLEGQTKNYYKLYFNELALNVLVPLESAKQLGVRALSSLEEMEHSHIHFFSKFRKLPVLTSERKNLLDTKLRSGKLLNLTEVIRDLICASKYELKLTAHDKSSLQIASNMVNKRTYVCCENPHRPSK
ncbi:CarD family transcriptional regulator [Paenibacillus sp. ISL-20]|uniref:CarD family transcriptional regulator n=1 Tax=Paenibacillus sp. ISL-20 TaxID=2819163 RepID=UPI001BE8BA4B|nr:CarD family transcriptional regulator [Paenibacillus sp. ISL-20]MBT2765047.1 hypothetical protein [Paenibacillus sp. ISL-20]